MDKKIGRNDPCSCGSGKKYKSCCALKAVKKQKITAKWLNAPQGPNLMERTFGKAIASATREFSPLKDETSVQPLETEENNK
ncbi:MAG: SEC-C metal-binding domain-containing protein [Parachlamydiaceae bacterium]